MKMTAITAGLLCFLAFGGAYASSEGHSRGNSLCRATDCDGMQDARQGHMMEQHVQSGRNFQKTTHGDTRPGAEDQGHQHAGSGQ